MQANPNCRTKRLYVFRPRWRKEARNDNCTNNACVRVFREVSKFGVLKADPTSTHYRRRVRRVVSLCEWSQIVHRCENAGTLESDVVTPAPETRFALHDGSENTQHQFAVYMSQTQRDHCGMVVSLLFERRTFGTRTRIHNALTGGGTKLVAEPLRVPRLAMNKRQTFFV